MSLIRHGEEEDQKARKKFLLGLGCPPAGHRDGQWMEARCYRSGSEVVEQRVQLCRRWLLTLGLAALSDVTADVPGPKNFVEECNNKGGKQSDTKRGEGVRGCPRNVGT